MAAADRGERAALRAVEEPIRAAEIVGALSLATDLGTGQPLEHAPAHRRDHGAPR